MINKTFTRFFLTTLKKTASITYGLEVKKAKLAAQIADLQGQADILQQQIDSFNAPIKKETLGYTSLDLVKRVVNDKGQVKWELKYPNTVLPINAGGVEPIDMNPTLTIPPTSTPSPDSPTFEPTPAY